MLVFLYKQKNTHLYQLTRKIAKIREYYQIHKFCDLHLPQSLEGYKATEAKKEEEEGYSDVDWRLQLFGHVVRPVFQAQLQLFLRIVLLPLFLLNIIKAQFYTAI